MYQIIATRNSCHPFVMEKFSFSYHYPPRDFFSIFSMISFYKARKIIKRDTRKKYQISSHYNKWHKNSKTRRKWWIQLFKFGTSSAKCLGEWKKVVINAFNSQSLNKWWWVWIKIFWLLNSLILESLHCTQQQH